MPLTQFYLTIIYRGATMPRMISRQFFFSFYFSFTNISGAALGEGRSAWVTARHQQNQRRPERGQSRAFFLQVANEEMMPSFAIVRSW